MGLSDEHEIRSAGEWRLATVDIECPHCRRAQVLSAQNVTPDDSESAGISEGLRVLRCRSESCRQLIVILQRLRVVSAHPAPTMYASEQMIWRRHRGLPPSLETLPDDLKKDAGEAFATADDSPRASAALSRRFVQAFIRSVLRIEKRDLDKEIEAVLEERLLPPRLAEDLDAVRQVGNFAVHPIKAEETGAVLAVEPGETEWLLSVVSGLAEWHAQEQQRAAAREALNEKLRAAGKPELKSAQELPDPSAEAGTL